MSKISLTWLDLNSSEEGHRVYRSNEPMDPNALPAPLATLGPDVDTYDDLDILDGALYYYRVSAFSGAVEKVSDELPVIAEDSGDPYWANVVSLLHFDAGYADETGRSWISEGSGLSIQQDATKFGAGALRNSNTTSSLNGSPLAGLSANEPFALECWIRLENPSSVEAIMSQSGNGGDTDQFFYVAPPKYATSPPNPHNHRVLGFYRGGKVGGGGVVIYGSTEVVSGVFYHVALTFDGSTTRLFLNGNLEASSAVRGWVLTQYPFRIAGNLVPSYPQYRTGFAGSIDELRITKGVARYTESFTPPTEPFPNFGD